MQQGPAARKLRYPVAPERAVRREIHWRMQARRLDERWAVPDSRVSDAGTVGARAESDFWRGSAHRRLRLSLFKLILPVLMMRASSTRFAGSEQGACDEGGHQAGREGR